MWRFEDGVGVRGILRLRVLRLTLAALLAIDLVLLGFHAAHVWSEWSEVQTRFSDPRFSVESEDGFAEGWEVAKTALCVLALADTARRSGEAAYAALGLAYLIALLDNAFEIHETGGAWVATALQGSARRFESAPLAFGELVIFAVLALLIGGILLAGFRRSAPGHWPAAFVLVALLIALAGFGIGVDLVHAALGGIRRAVDRGLGTIEDGGELVILSLAASYAVGLNRWLAPRAQARGSG